MQRPSTPPDPAKVLEAALDVFVYAPIGFAFDAREVVPKLVERGRNQVALARLFGRYAMRRGQAEAERILNDRRAAAPAPAGDARATADVDTDVDPTDAPTVAPLVPPAPAKAAPATAPTAPTGSKKKAAPKARGAGVKKLPIPGYDSLSASQVIPRLDALRPRELEAVREHEAANRARRTILNRIAQLQA
jgi:hypothetical protein